MKTAFAAALFVLSFAASPSMADGRTGACDLLEKVRATYNLPGLSAAVGRKDGSVVEIALGRSEGDGAAIMPGDRFLSGSIGKTYAAALAMDLHERGELDLDAPVKDRLGGQVWYDTLPNAQTMTMRQLLTHTSGLPSHVDEPAFQKAISDRIRRCAECLFTPREAVAFLDGKKPLFAPGRGWAYSETGYLVAGLAIEKATGRAYYDLLRERILAPLGLKETTPSDRNDIDRLVSGRIDPDGNYFGLSPLRTKVGGRLVFNPGFEWTGGGLAVSSADLVRWAHRLYGGTAFPEPYMQDLLASAPTGAPDARYGLGVGVRGRGAKVSYGHSGAIPGYRAGLRYYPATGVAVAVQTNADIDDDTVFPSAIEATLKAAALLSGRSQTRSAFTGVRCP